MNEPIGLRIWTEFTRLRTTDSQYLCQFGELPISGTLCAGDGGTFACHVKERVKKGTWTLFRLSLDDLGTVMALVEGAEPVFWEFAGGIIIDTAVGTILPKSSLDDINSMDDPEEITDIVDDAIFGSDDDEVVIETPNGKKFAVFQLPGDGTYNVFKGMGNDKKVCALAVVIWDRDDSKEHVR